MSETKSGAAAVKKPWIKSTGSFANGVCRMVLMLEDGRTVTGEATYTGDEPQGEARHEIKKAARNAALKTVDIEYND